MKIRVLTESGCGLTKQEANDLGIDFLPLQVQIEDKTYLDGFNSRRIKFILRKRLYASNKHATIRRY